MRGGVLGYAAQASPKIDAARTEKDPFRMETRLAAQKIGDALKKIPRHHGRVRSSGELHA